MLKKFLAIVLIVFPLLFPGCIPLDWETSTTEEIGQPTWLTDEEIISLVRKGIMAWAEARAVFIRKGYTWTEAELKLKAIIPEREWIK